MEGFKAFEQIKHFCSGITLCRATRSGRLYGTMASGTILLKQGKIKGRTIHYGRGTMDKANNR